ncbi:MAG: N-acetyltransferase [Betaproteobacteria bacterium]|nr:N-acetyltransferase [Betaproteobacteria bacterium]
MTTLSLSNNIERHRYEAAIDGKVAGFSEYNLSGDSIVFTHTEVLEEGKGVGSFLAREALLDARAKGMHVIPVCPFIAAYLRKHREFIDLVKPEVQVAFKV